MKLLFICSTEFQLFNTLNLKVHLFPNDSADIIIQFLKNDTANMSNRIASTGIFDNVSYRLPDIFDLHEYARCIRKGDFSKSFISAVTNSTIEIFTRLSSRKKQDYIDNIRECVYNIDSLDFSSYDALFAGGTNYIVTNVLKTIHVKNPDCVINMYEEGLSSYCGDQLGNDCQDISKDYIYLYEPQMALYKHPSFIQIPKVDRNDKEFLTIANYIFDFSPQEEVLENKIIFFDNPSIPMPRYLTYNHFLSHTVFRIPYKKHLQHHTNYLRQLQAYRLLTRYAGGREILVKLHPRTDRDCIATDYAGDYTTIMNDYLVPWELFCCNCQIRNNVFITMDSSAAYANQFVINEQDSNTLLILSEYINHEAPDLQYTKAFYEKMTNRKKNHSLFFPLNEKEYIETMKGLFT